MIKKDLELYLEAQARAHDLDAAILIGLAMAESSGRWVAERKEPAYRWVVNASTGKPFRKLTDAEAVSKTAPKGFPGIEGVTTSQEEWDGQRTSYGPLQIMGAVAREYGFKGRFSELNGMEGARLGIVHLLFLNGRFFADEGMEGVIEAYNRGRPDTDTVTKYARKVFNFAEQYREHAGR